MSSPRHSQKIEISIYVNDAGSPSTKDPRPDKPPVVIKVKDTARRKLEFDQGISKTSPNQRNEISNVGIPRQTSAGPIRIIETPTSSAGPSCFRSVSIETTSPSSDEPSTSSGQTPGPCKLKGLTPGPSTLSGRTPGPAKLSGKNPGHSMSSGRTMSSGQTPGPSTSSGRTPGHSLSSGRTLGPSTSSGRTSLPSMSNGRTPTYMNIKRVASRPEVLSAQQTLKVVKQILLDRSSCPQQHSPLIRKRLPGGKRPLSSDEESDNEDDNSEVKFSSSCEGTSNVKKEPEVFPQQEIDEEADSGSDIEIIGEEWPNKCQVKKEKVHVSSQTQTDDCEPFNDGVHQTPSFPGIFSGIQFCIFGDKKEILKNRILSCGGTVCDTPLELDDEITSLFISSYSVCESRLELSSNALWEYRGLYRDYNIVTISRDWVLDSMDRRALQPLINYLVNDNRGAEIPDI